MSAHPLDPDLGPGPFARHAPVLASSARTRGPSPLGALGLALTLVASGSAIGLALAGLGPNALSRCGDACTHALADGAFARLLGLPVLAWAAALHAALIGLTWALVLARASASRHHRALVNASWVLLALLLTGTATYLVVGLVRLEVGCKLCLAMHGLAMASALGATLHLSGASPTSDAPTSDAPTLASSPDTADRWRRLAPTALTLALAGGAIVAGAWLFGRPRRVEATPTAQWLGAVCTPSSCPSDAHFDPRALPASDEALVLARPAPGHPTLVAWLDLACPACRADFAALEPLLRDLASGSGPGLSLLLRADAAACDPLASGGAPSACEAPTAMLCAARHGGPTAALDHLAWELAATPGYLTLADRRAALSNRSPAAARCLDDELALGPRGTLAAHARAARRLAGEARAHATCGEADQHRRPGASSLPTAEPAWWCFEGTPSFAIVQSPAAPARSAPSDLAQTRALGMATGVLRANTLRECLEARP